MTRRPGTGPGVLSALLVLAAGAALGSAVTYAVLTRLPSRAGPDDPPAAGGSSLEGIAPVRAALLAQEIPLFPGPPGERGVPPDGFMNRLALPSLGDLPVWWGPVPADGNLLRLHALVARTVEQNGGEILAGWEDVPDGPRGDGEETYRRLPVATSFRASLPGTDPDASLWLGIGRNGALECILCLQKSPVRRP